MIKTSTLKGSKKIDFTDGPLFWRMLTFALPIIATAILQNLYNVADKVVVGQFSGDDGALGAIGSTSFFSSLVVNFLFGMSAGVGVIFSQLKGANDTKRMKRAVSTALILGVITAAVMSVIGYALAEPVLTLLGTKENLFDSALLYVRITFTGLLAIALYNMGAAILRAVGDSKTPLIIGAVSGAINVLLNIFFVCVCGMSVDGVAIATVASQYFSAVAVLILIFKRKGEPYHISKEDITFDGALSLHMLRLGVPNGIQSACYSITSMITSWAVNSFPEAYVSARSIALDIDHVVSAFVSAFCTVTMTAVGQNYGAKKPDRVKKSFGIGFIQSLVIGLVVSLTMFVFRREVAMLFVSPDNELYHEIINATVEWTGVMLSLYFVQGLLQSVTGTVRGMGYSFSSMLINLIGTCGVRIAWVYLVFPLEPFHTFPGLALLYPVSWAINGILLTFLAIYAFVKFNKEMQKEEEEKRQREAREAAIEEGL